VSADTKVKILAVRVVFEEDDADSISRTSEPDHAGDVGSLWTPGHTTSQSGNPSAPIFSQLLRALTACYLVRS
jgi:hypothetical protein